MRPLIVRITLLIAGVVIGVFALKAYYLSGIGFYINEYKNQGSKLLIKSTSIYPLMKLKRDGKYLTFGNISGTRKLEVPLEYKLLYSDFDAYYSDFDSRNCSVYTGIFHKKIISFRKECAQTHYESTNYYSESMLIRGRSIAGIKKKLLIYNHGHGGIPNSDESWATNLVLKVLNAGNDVLIISMPLVGLNKFKNKIIINTWDGRASIDEESPEQHAYLAHLNTGRSSILRLFIDDAIFAYMNLNGYYDEISYVGFSGGAWVGLSICSILRNKLNQCVLASGVLPSHLRLTNKNIGDFEQFDSRILSSYNIYSTIENIALSSTNLNLVYNRRDPCCFDGDSALAFKNSLENNLKLGKIIRIENFDKHRFDENQIFSFIH